MSKIALITDTHFGVRNDSQIFSEYFKDYYDNDFFPFLIENDIKHVIHLGDVFDRRKFVNFSVLAEAKKYFFERFDELGIECHIIAGNHDVFLRSSNEISSIDLLLGDYKNIHTYLEPKVVDICGESILLMPWINNTNYQNCIDILKSAPTRYVFGHFEIQGFVMHAGSVCESGLTKDVFDGFEGVFSGHFHHRSIDGNIAYLGNPYHMTWGDYGDARGFHVFDVNEDLITFVPNHKTLFVKLEYDDAFQKPEVPTGLEGKYIKVLVQKKTNFKYFDAWIDKISHQNPIEVKVMEDMSHYSQASDIDIKFEDTVTLLTQYVDKMELDDEKVRNSVKNILGSLYKEACGVEQ